MPRLHPVVTNAGRDASVSTVLAKTFLPRSKLYGVGCYRTVRVVAVATQQLGDRTFILRREECCFGDLVVASSEESANRDLLSAPAPAISGRKQSRTLNCSHGTYFANLDQASRRMIKIIPFELTAMHVDALRGCLRGGCLANLQGLPGSGCSGVSVLGVDVEGCVSRRRVGRSP